MPTQGICIFIFVVIYRIRSLKLFGGITLLADGTLRLVGGPSSNKGLLEVAYNGVWGTVCNTNWGIGYYFNALVACRQLGFATGQLISSAPFPTSSGPIWLNEVWCEFSYMPGESLVNQCPFDGWGDNNYCDHDQDVALECFEEWTPAELECPRIRVPSTGIPGE